MSSWDFFTSVHFKIGLSLYPSLSFQCFSLTFCFLEKSGFSIYPPESPLACFCMLYSVPIWRYFICKSGISSVFRLSFFCTLFAIWLGVKPYYWFIAVLWSSNIQLGWFLILCCLLLFGYLICILSLYPVLLVLLQDCFIVSLIIAWPLFFTVTCYLSVVVRFRHICYSSWLQEFSCSSFPSSYSVLHLVWILEGYTIF